MATTITAGNATNGLVITPDNTGILELKTGTGAGTTALTVNTSQNVGIGTSSPSNKLDVAGVVRVSANSGSVSHLFQFNENGGEIVLYNNTGDSGTLIDLSSGTTRALHVLSTGGLQVGLGSANTTGVIQFMRAGFAEAMRIDSSGNVLVTNAGGGLGYGTGSGGTVTQATNKSTAVTLNKPTGQITMNNAALGAGAAVAFGVNNTLCTTSDVVIVNANGFGSYRIEIQNVSSGNFAIRVTNVSGGSLSEAVVINFAIIKGATS